MPASERNSALVSLFHVRKFSRRKKVIVVMALLFSMTVLLRYDSYVTFQSSFAQKNIYQIQNTIFSIKSNILMLKPLVDTSKQSEEDVILEMQKTVTNFPFMFWFKNKKKLPKLNSTCAKFPKPEAISYNNLYWQHLQTSNGSFFLYAAYYDNRSLAKIPTVRILGMINRYKPTVKTHCQFWFNGEEKPYISEVIEYQRIWLDEWGLKIYKNLQPYLVSCLVPNTTEQKVPQSVSLVENACETSTSNLRVINNRPKNIIKEDIAVCVKFLFFSHDSSVKLVEWLELLFILGAKKVFLYDLEMHPNITKVLNYYQTTGKVEVTPFKLPGYQPNLPGFYRSYFKSEWAIKRLAELIPYNDCLYRNIYKYEFLLLLDTDEVIVPRSVENWHLLIEKLRSENEVKKKTIMSYCASNAYFFDSMTKRENYFQDIPDFMHMLQHVHRSSNYTTGHKKCFHNTDYVLTLHNHYPFKCFRYCTNKPIDTVDAHLQHYRSDCNIGKSCELDYKKYITKDTSILRYKNNLTSNVVKTLDKLGFFERDISLL